MNPEDISNLILMGCDEADKNVNLALSTAPMIVTATIRTHPLTFLLPGGVQDHIISILLREINKAADLIRDAIKQFRLLAKSLGSPTQLRAAATTLGTSVSDATGNLTEAMVPSALLGLNPEHWNSLATTPYSTGLNEQSVAANGIGAIVRELQRTLGDMADSIETFYGDLNWAWFGVATAAIGLGVAIITLETGVGPIIGLALAILGVLTAVISLVMVFTAAGERNASDAENLASNPGIVWKTSVFAA